VTGATGPAGTNGTNGTNGVIGATGATGPSYFTLSGTNVYYNGGNIGIGTATPSYKLDVVGDINVSGAISGATITNINSTINALSTNVGDYEAVNNSSINTLNSKTTALTYYPATIRTIVTGTLQSTSGVETDYLTIATKPITDDSTYGATTKYVNNRILRSIAGAYLINGTGFSAQILPLFCSFYDPTYQLQGAYGLKSCSNGTAIGVNGTSQNFLGFPTANGIDSVIIMPNYGIIAYSGTWWSGTKYIDTFNDTPYPTVVNPTVANGILSIQLFYGTPLSNVEINGR
jgi:hypothetical protein